MRHPPQFWSQANTEALQELRASGRTYDQCSAVLGRSRWAVKAKIEAINGTHREHPSDNPRGPSCVPPEVIADRERLRDAYARQGDVARMMGEPPPGFSA